MPYLIAVPFAVCVLALIVSQHKLAGRHADQLRQVLSRIDGERHSWARERQELLNRIQHPAVVHPLLPVAPPAEGAAEPAPAADDPFQDQMHLVGRILSGPVDDAGNPIHDEAA